MRNKLTILLALTIICAQCWTGGSAYGMGKDPLAITEVKQTPWMIEAEGVLKSETRLTIENAGESTEAWVKINATGVKPYIQAIGTLAAGTNQVVVDVAELLKDGDKVTFSVYGNAEGKGRPLGQLTKEQKKIRHWKIFVAHDVHMDIGYTDSQEQLNEVIFPGFLDEALQKAEETESLDKNDRFRYPVEASYMLYESAWNARNADWIEQLKQSLHKGSMTYPSSYVNQVYQGLGTEQLARMAYYSERLLKDKLGVSSNKMLYMSDDPSFSWAAIDTMAESGIKYLMMRQNPDPLFAYPKLFYYEGLNPRNKVLAYNYGHYSTDEFDFRNADSQATAANVTEKVISNYHKEDYPYDAIIADFTTPYDNKPVTASVQRNIKELNARKNAGGRDYVYPAFISSTVNDYFEYIDSHYEKEIPTYKGNIEGWWNYGVSSASYETGINKENHEKVPAAEFFATMASSAVDGIQYPYEQILSAYNDMTLFDEHSWGNSFPQADEQWVWKRNTALAAGRQADRLIDDSLSAISSLIPADEGTIAVYNSLSWERSDLVTVETSGLPEHFTLEDAGTGEAVPYQRLEGGKVAFVAENVPGLGYKTFKAVEAAEEPQFASGIQVTDSTMENEYFKVTFDGTGAIASIVDKLNGGKEMVDASAPYRMNEFVYHTTKLMSPELYSTFTVKQAQLTGTGGPVMGIMTADGATAGLNGMKRKVILYDGIPRIDIVNEVDKTEAPSYSTQDEEGFFVFPLNVPNFDLRHEMPSGAVKPFASSDIRDRDNEQFYGSSTAYFTVNRWIDASDKENYGITLSPLSNPIVQYGERRSAMGDWDYHADNPWVYSFVFNNKWHTNFQKTQPGPVTFKYSLASHQGGSWQEGRADRFGMNASNALQANVIASSQAGGAGLAADKDQFIGIDKDNVVLTTAKLAEASGEGTILRFNETLGRDTKVTVNVGFLQPEAVVETDLVENDRSPLALKDGTVSFTIKAHGWMTLRLTGGEAPGKLENLQAVTDDYGTQLTWDAAREQDVSYYEIYRGTESGFEPGAGHYLASVSGSHYLDRQVVPGLTHSYFYKVRAVKAGRKGIPSDAAQPAAGSIGDTAGPTAPSGLDGHARSASRVTLSWEPSSDNVSVKGYKVYRDGEEIKDLSGVYLSFLDTEAAGQTTYSYSVKAYDDAGNLSEMSSSVEVTTPELALSGGNIAPLAKVAVSSAFNADYGGSKAVDGVSGMHGSGEWASAGETNPWIELAWDEPKKVSKVSLYDRINLDDNALSGNLLFSDGSVIPVVGISEDGAVKEVVFDEKNITWVKFEVTGGAGSNVGLSEIKVFEPANLAREAILSASSWYDEGNAPAKAADGIVGVHGSGEWSSKGEQTPWLSLEWVESKMVNQITLYDRVNTDDNAVSGRLTFSDGSSIEVTDIPADGSAKTVSFPSRAITWIKFEVTGGEGSHVGLSEIHVFEAENAAVKASVTASSEYNGDYGASKVTDGIIAVQGAGEWASLGEKEPWIRLEWAEPRTMNQIILHDRMNLLDDARGGTLSFSDGTSIEVADIPANGEGKAVTFPDKTVTWVKLEL
ncbi:MAG: hypothetical protein K0R28_3768, partial [Paenibacillus sp.]|nr:hypothetical protein [Paenibacillus sp.]